MSSRLREGKRRSSVLDQPAPSLALTVAVLRTSHQKELCNCQVALKPHVIGENSNARCIIVLVSTTCCFILYKVTEG